MSTPAPASPPPPSLAARLRDVRVSLRGDLEIARSRMRGEACYIVRDPVTFQSHKLSVADYGTLIRINVERSLGELWSELVRGGAAREDGEESFYNFIATLHRLGFLSLPNTDHQALFRRFAARESAARRKRWTSVLFFPLPLCNPDSFLNRTISLARPLFTPIAFLVWLAVVASAGAIAWARAHDLQQPLDALLATRNLVTLWLTLIVLKTWHELGHAYACKHFGGYVPEIGVNLILFTPCAYVDASACWMFPRKLHRIIVCLAGMYFESFIAALAVFVWAATPPGLVHSVAYNIMFLASIVTVLFNVNPLMRYDGYYVLSDWLEIPNLRARAQQELSHWSKRWLLGLNDGARPAAGAMLPTLLSFGALAGFYRYSVTLGICALLAIKLQGFGLLVGGLMLAALLGGSFIGALRYLWFAEETRRVRPRAAALGAALALGAPTALFAVPARSNVLSVGVTQRAEQCIVRAEDAGFLRSLDVAQGPHVEAGGAIASLENSSRHEALLAAQAALDAARAQFDRFIAEGDPRAAEQRILLAAAESTLQDRRAALAALSLKSAIGGEVVSRLDASEVGRFVEPGEAIATIAAGPWQVRTLLTDEQLAAAAPRIGDLAEFRSDHRPEVTLHGQIRRVRPVGSRAIALLPLTQVGGGDIVVDADGAAQQPYFELVVELDAVGQPGLLRHNMTGHVRLPGQSEPLGLHILRRAMRFVDQVLRV